MEEGCQDRGDTLYTSDPNVEHQVVFGTFEQGSDYTLVEQPTFFTMSAKKRYH